MSCYSPLSFSELPPDAFLFKHHGRDITELFIIALVVVILDKVLYRLFQFTGRFIRQKTDFSFDAAVIPLNFAVSLGVAG